MVDTNKKVKAPAEKIPSYMADALQGLAYWVGYRRARFRHYHAQEAAVCAELWCLLSAHIVDGLRVVPEYPLKKIVKKPPASKERVDIVIAKKEKGKVRENLEIEYVIEVKLAKYSKSNKLDLTAIQKDLKRLAAIKKERPKLRTIIVLVSERCRRIKFVTDEGIAKRQDFEIDGTSTEYFRIRRVCKVSDSFIQELDMQMT